MPDDMIYGDPMPGVRSASDPKAISAAAHIDDQRTLDQANDLRAVLAMPEGRRVLERILSRSRIYQTSFDEHHARMAAHAGERNIGLWLLGEIGGVDPYVYPKMLVERVQRLQLEEAQRTSLSDQK